LVNSCSVTKGGNVTTFASSGVTAINTNLH